MPPASLKREKRNNPEKAIPRKERKAAAEEALKAKEAGDAAAKTAATVKATDKAARQGRPKHRRRADASLPWPTASASPASVPRTAFAAR